MKTRGTRRWTIDGALLVAVLVASPARATVLCGKKDTATGQLREGSVLHVRGACRATELQADLASLGLSAQPQVAVRLGNTVTTNGTSISTPAPCEPGEVATGGGVLASGANGGVAVMRSSRPEPDTAGAVPTSWRVTVANTATTGTIAATAYAVCAAP